MYRPNDRQCVHMVVGRVSGRVINVAAPVLLCGCHATVGRVRVRVWLRVRVRVRVRCCAIKLATPKSKGFEGVSKNSNHQRALTCRVIAVVPIFAAAIAVAAGNWFPVFTLETLQTI